MSTTSFTDQVTLARIEPGMYVYTSPEADGVEVGMPNPTVHPGIARRVKEARKEGGERWLVFGDGTRTTPRNGTTMVYRFHLDKGGKPVPVPTYPVCPQCNADETDPSCHTASGAWTSWHAARHKAGKPTPAKGERKRRAVVDEDGTVRAPGWKGGEYHDVTPKGVTHVEVDGVVVATTEHKDVTPAKPAKPAGKGTVRKDDLVHALTAIRDLAGDDKAIPVLMGVKVECEPGDSHLTLAATDRYVLGSIQLPWDGGAVDALLPAETVKDLLAFARKADRIAPIELTFSERQLVADDMLRKATYPLDVEHEFVRWRGVLPEVERYADGEVFGVNPAFIGRFAKAARDKGDAMVIRFMGPLKPLRVEIGEHFVGLIMPVRIPDDVRRGTTDEQEREAIRKLAQGLANEPSVGPVEVVDVKPGTEGVERFEPEVEAAAEGVWCPECHHAPGIHYAPGTGDPKQRCRVFTCGCSTDFGVRQLDTVDAAPFTGEHGRRVERDAEGKVRIVDWTGGERDEVTPAGRHVHIDADGAVTERPAPKAEPHPLSREVVEKRVEAGKCSTCKGFGLVRKRGSRAGGAYKTASGAYEAQQGGNASECPACGGEGQVAA